MYLLIEGEKPSTHEIVKCDLERAMTRINGQEWELIGIELDSIGGEKEIKIAIFETKDEAYKALRQLFDAITSGSEEWDVVQFKNKVDIPF